MPRIEVSIQHFVESLSIQELESTQAIVSERLRKLRAIRLDDTEKKMLHGPVGQIERGRQLTAMAHLKSRTGMDLRDARVVVEAFCNGSFRG